MTGTLELPRPTWIVGCGNMAGAILDGWRAGGLDLSPIVIIDPVGKEIEGTRAVRTVKEAGPPPELVLLGFKPQMLGEVAPQLKPFLGTKSLILSILAGVELETLRGHFPHARGIVRAMPNLAVAVRRGVIGLYGNAGSTRLNQQVGDLFAALGYAMWMADEERLAALGSVAGAGPAYAARFIAALAKAGVKRGLSEEIASTLAIETVLGTAWMATANGESMESIAQRVASPNGTTEAGLKILDHEHVLEELIALTVDAAARRGAELAEETKGPSLAETERLS